MPSTSVHLPAELIEKLDRLAAARGTSRNRIIRRACEDLLAAQRGEWPDDLFDSPLATADLQLLREAGRDMEDAIYASRSNRSGPPL